MLVPVRTLAPAATPISLQDVKRHLRIDHSEEESLLLALIDAAVSLLDGWEGYMGRALITQEWSQSFPYFGGGIRLAFGPAASVSEVSYYDTDNVTQTLSTSVYRLLEDELGPYIGLVPTQTWPSYYGRSDAVTVTWVAGQEVADLPRAIKQAMLLMVGHWYENREAVIVGQAAMEMPLAAEMLLKPFRRQGPSRQCFGLETIPYAQLWPVLD